MKKNFWLWTVLIFFLFYGILFGYSQSMIPDDNESTERSPVVSENRPESPIEASSGRELVKDSIKI